MIENPYSDVFCIVEKDDKYEAFEQIISSCAIFSSLPESLDKFIASVIRRERKQTTDIGHGVAIAHGKVLGLKKTVIGLGFSQRGIVFKDGGEPVHLIFVIASPLSTGSDYLQSVAALLSWVHDMEFRRELAQGDFTDNVASFLEMLEKCHYHAMKE